MSSEVKRISLKTVPINSNNNNNIINNNLDKSETNKKSKDNNKSKDNKEPKTKRFVLELNSDNNQCNEFSYNDLIKANVGKNGDQLNGLNANDDPLADNNEEYKLRQLEKEFQEKYGPKKRSQWEDYIDKGMGYDETDPFIDNEEAYDELVPSTLTTQYGGFYINCGELEFRPLSADENDNDDDEDNIRPVLKRKRKLELESGKRRRSSTDLNRKSRKNKIPSPGKTVAQMLQQKKLQQTNPNENDNEIEEIEINDSNSSPAVVVSASVRDIVDSVAKGEDQVNDDERNGSAGSSDAEDIIKKDNSIPVVKLPDGLPPELSSTIDKIKKLAHSSHDGKRNFFTQDVNKMLYDIEKKSRELLASHRTQIYSHLASHLPCTKQTLMSRAKKVLCETNEYNLQTAIANIRTIVVSLHLEVISRYRKQCEEIKQTFERNKQNGLISPQTELKFPKRLFPWNDKLRSLFNEAIHYKINLYEQLGPKNQSITLRDYLYEFFDKEIKPIWPKGWMSSEILKQKAKWVKQILPPEQQSSQQPSQQTTQSTSQPIAHSSHTSAPNQSSQQIISLEKANKVQTPTQQTSEHKKPQTYIEIIGRQSIEIVANNDKIESIEQKLPSNTTIKSLSSSHSMPKMNDQMSEGLGSKFIPAVKEVKDNVNNSSIDLSTKARSSPKPLNTPNVRLSPVNLKTSPNITVIKSNSPSPSVSPLAMTSILQSSKQHEKISRESCLQKVIEQSLGDFPNSSAISQRNSKTSLLPQTSSPNTEMFIKGFNSTPNKDSKTDICIEIASSPEPYKKVQHQQQSHQQKHLLQQIQQQKLHQKAQQSQHKIANKHLSTTTTTSTTNSPSNQHSFHRNSDMHKNKVNVSNQSMNSAQKQEMRQTAQTMDHLLLQSQIARNANRDTSISITPIPQNKSNESNSNSSSKHHSNPNSRYSNSASVITSTSSPMNLANQQLLNLHMWSNLSPQLLSSYNASTFHRLFGAQTPQPFVPTSSSQNHSLYYPQFNTPSTTTTTTHQTGEGRGRTSN